MAEFALVLTPCLTLFFGIINFALALYCYDFVCYSAQQAVRYATVHGSTATTPATASSMTTYVNALVVGVLKTSALTDHHDVVAEQHARRRGDGGGYLQLPAADEPGLVGHDPAHAHGVDGNHAVAAPRVATLPIAAERTES